MQQLLDQLKRHEGFRSNYYLCTAGKKTIGYGRNVDDNPFTMEELELLGRTCFDKEPMTKTEAELLLTNDVSVVTAKLAKTPLDTSALCPAREAVCINMAFNLGTNGLLKFKNMIAAINSGDFEQAANEMLNSRWAKQVQNRAMELSKQMFTGAWS